MNDGKWQVEDKNWNGQIRQFYAGKKILLTGCTGFFGTGIVDKILRTCQEVDKLYVMVRPKKNMTIEERLNKYFQDPAFATLHKTNPNFMAKVHPIYGDLVKVNLDISPEDYRLLTENVDIIIHNAAEVSFSAKVSNILKINVLGTKYMLDLAAKCSRMKAFVYVSTAYSHSYNKIIEEKFYSPPCGLKMVEDMIQSDESTPYGLTDSSVRDMLGKWVNTYTFSKSVAESLVEDFSRKTTVACAVYRPSIVVASLGEPYPGWIGNQNGPALLFIALNMGLLHVLPIKEDSVCDFVPVDMAVNALLASIWDLVLHKKSKEAQVYNYGASYWKPASLVGYRKMFFEVAADYPFSNMVWYPFALLAQNLYSFVLLHIVFHLIPAAVCDAVLYVLGKKTKVLKIAWKFTKFLVPVYYFTTGNWVVKVQNTQDILIHMNGADYKEFPFDLGRMHWRDALYSYMHSVRTNLMNESPSKLPAAKKKYQQLKTIHYTVCALALVFSVFFLYRMICRSYC